MISRIFVFGQENSIKVLEKYFNGYVLSDLSIGLIEDYIESRKSQINMKTGNRISPATINRELACLSYMLNKAIEWNMLGKDKLVKIKNEGVFRKDKIFN